MNLLCVFGFNTDLSLSVETEKSDFCAQGVNVFSVQVLYVVHIVHNVKFCFYEYWLL